MGDDWFKMTYVPVFELLIVKFIQFFTCNDVAMLKIRRLYHVNELGTSFMDILLQVT